MRVDTVVGGSACEGSAHQVHCHLEQAKVLGAVQSHVRAVPHTDGHPWKKVDNIAVGG